MKLQIINDSVTRWKVLQNYEGRGLDKTTKVGVWFPDFLTYH